MKALLLLAAVAWQEDLKLDHLWVVHRGSKRYSLGKGVDAVPLAELGTLRGPGG